MTRGGAIDRNAPYVEKGASRPGEGRVEDIEFTFQIERGRPRNPGRMPGGGEGEEEKKQLKKRGGSANSLPLGEDNPTPRVPKSNHPTQGRSALENDWGEELQKSY